MEAKEEMARVKVKPDVVTYSTLIKASFGSNKPNQVLKKKECA